MIRDWNNDIIDTSEFDFDEELNQMLLDFDNLNSPEDDLHQSALCFDLQTY